MTLAFGAVVVIGLAGAWTWTYLAGGTQSVLPHAFYLPVIVAAARFRALGALVVGVAAGLLCGPLMPLDVVAGIEQSWGNWAARLGAFVVVGQLTAFACRHSEASVRYAVGAWMLHRRIGRALAAGELRLEYQPIVAIDTVGERIVGVEVLVRWDDPRHGPIPPDQFIPQAEHTGCIRSITRFVLDEACRQAAEWRTTVLADVDEFTVSVNVSGGEVADPDLHADVAGALATHQVPPSWLHLEITETALVDDVPGAEAALRRLHDLGVQLAIDDFGTGESSLGNLHRFPIDVLKLDRTFLHRLERHARGHLLVEGIVQLAHRLELVTVAEGIETDAQLAILRDSGCDYAQGYFFARPGRPAVVEQLLATCTARPLPSEPSAHAADHC